MQKYRTNHSEIFFIFCILSLVIDFIYLRLGIALNGISVIWVLCAVLADSTLGVLPFIFLKGKKRFWVFLILSIASILVLANVVYFRNFSDMIGGVTYLSNVLDIRVTQGAVSSLRLIDTLPFVSLLIPLLGMIYFSPRQIAQGVISPIFKKVILIICLLCWILSMIGSTRRYAIYREKHTLKEAVYEMLHFDGTWRDRYNAFNFTGYSIESIWRIASKSRSPLTVEEIQKIKDHISSKYEKPDSNVIDDRKRNLIIIVVESLQSNVLQLKNSDKIAPALDSLAKSPSTLFVRDCIHLAGPGRSSDAQFVINTGLLPLRDEAFVSNYGEGDYPSLAKAFSGETKEIIGESEQCWFHYLTNKSYGYASFVQDIADKCIDQDSIIFGRALSEIPKMQKPFYLFLSTLSMHDPFIEEKVSDRAVEKYIKNFSDDRDKEYLRRVSFFDKQLGGFINQIKKMGLYDETLIIIVGDHEVNKNTISESLWGDTVPLFILDEGKRDYRTIDVSQMDIFPTILSVLGLDYEYKRFGVRYSGLGRSLYDLSSSGIPTDADYKISERIIKGR